MKITHFMLTVSLVIFAWMTVSYLRPVPSNTYEHASDSFTQATPASSEVLAETTASE